MRKNEWVPEHQPKERVLLDVGHKVGMKAGKTGAHAAFFCERGDMAPGRNAASPDTHFLMAITRI